MEIPNHKIDTILGAYIRSKPKMLDSIEIINKIENYRSNFAKKLISLTPDVLISITNKRSNWNIGDNVYVSLKVDGESAFFVYDENEVGHKSYFCKAVTHRVWIGLAANLELEEIMKKKGIKKAIIPGELFASTTYPPDFQARSYVRDFISCSRNPSSQEDLDRIGFRVFDLIQIDDDDQWLEKSYSYRYDKMQEIFPQEGRVAAITTKIMDDSEIKAYYDDVVLNKGEEGLVIRNASTYKSYKVKPVYNLDAVIVGVVGGRAGSRLENDQVASTLLALRYEDGTYQIIGSCGGGLSDEQRTELWTKFDFSHSKGFVETTSDRRAFRMVKPKFVANINYLDINTHHTNGDPVFQNCVKYDEDTNEWLPVRLTPFIALISPRYVGDNPIREDKTIDSADLRISQITDLVTIDSPQDITYDEDIQHELFARYVFEKDDNVRKFLAWKTNRGESNIFFHNYVIFKTDYSTNRKNPLDRTARVTDDEKQMWQLFDEMIQEEMFNSNKTGLKKGWLLYSDEDIRDNPIEIPLD